MKAFGWSLGEIDETAVESLLPFLRRFNATGGQGGAGAAAPAARVYCDQVSWL